MQQSNNPNLIVILGATATGKTKLAVDIANNLDGEIISADSRQVYRGMDIGTGKDLDEYGDINYHLIDILDPGYEFNVYEYQKRFFDCFSDISSRNKTPILAGGTGLYIQAVIEKYHFAYASENKQLRDKLAEYDEAKLQKYLLELIPNTHNTTDLTDRNRTIRAIEIALAEKNSPEEPDFPELRPIILGIKWERHQLHARITERLKARIAMGMIDEVKGLIDTGVSYETLDFYGLEYRFVAQYLQKQITRNDMFQKLNSAIKRFAKKQETFFRRLEKHGNEIHWIDGGDDMASRSLEYLNSKYRKIK